MLKIIKPGIETTVQDGGRPGQRALGIPQSGAADRLHFAVANVLVGNKWAAPALEVAMGGLEITAQEDLRLALSGANMRADIDGRAITNHSAFTLKAGARLSFGFVQNGARAYLAVAGGLDGDIFAGSRSTYSPAGIGGHKGRALKAGDVLTGLGLEQQVGAAFPKYLCPILSKSIVLRVQKGPEFLSHINGDSRRRLFTNEFTAHSRSNRMGAQLSLSRADQPPLSLSQDESLISSPLLPGTLQITPNGMPILSGIDSHCTGGYARALTVIAADHWLMGQIAPGTQIYFRRVTSAAAQQALSLRNKIYGQYIPAFRFD